MQFQTHIRDVENPDLKYALLDFFNEESNLILLDGNTSNDDSFNWVVAGPYDVSAKVRPGVKKPNQKIFQLAINKANARDLIFII